MYQTSTENMISPSTVTLVVGDINPSAPSAGRMRFFWKTLGDVTQLYAIDSAGVVSLITGLAPAPAPDQAALTPSVDVSASLFSAFGFSSLACDISPTAGVGAFTAAYVLPDAAQVLGAIVEVNITLPASANPTVTLSDGGGSLKASVTSPDPTKVTYWYGRFRFDGTAWRLRFRDFQP